MELADKIVLLTGVTGFVGSRVVRPLLQAGMDRFPYLTKRPDTVGEPISPLTKPRFPQGVLHASVPSEGSCVRRHFGASEFANSIRPFFATAPFSQLHHMFGLQCGIWVIDCGSPQAYNVSVIRAPYER
jgi:hypothetical protein